MKLSIARNIEKLSPDEQVEVIGKKVRITMYEDSADQGKPVYASAGILRYLIISPDIVRFKLGSFQNEGSCPTATHYALIQWEME